MPHDWRNEEDHGRGSSNDCEEDSKSPGIGQDPWEGLEALKSAYAFRRSCLTSSWRVSSLERRPHSFYWAKRKRSSRTRRPPIIQYAYLTKIEKFYERIVASRIIRHLLVGESRTARGPVRVPWKAIDCERDPAGSLSHGPDYGWGRSYDNIFGYH